MFPLDIRPEVGLLLDWSLLNLLFWFSSLAPDFLWSFSVSSGPLTPSTSDVLIHVVLWGGGPQTRSPVFSLGSLMNTFRLQILVSPHLAHCTSGKRMWFSNIYTEAPGHRAAGEAPGAGPRVSILNPEALRVRRLRSR